MTGIEAVQRLKTLKLYTKAINEAISQIDIPNEAFGSTYPSDVLADIIDEFKGERLELEQKLSEIYIL